MHHRMWNVETEISKLLTKRLNEKTAREEKLKQVRRGHLLPVSSVFVKLG